MLTAERLIEMLNLKPHPDEGGYFSETYRSGERLPREALPARYEGPRPMGTAIYYLLTPQTRSRLHRLKSDEVWHFYLGDPVEMLALPPGGEGRTHLLGPDLLAGQCPQVLVPAGVWMGARLLPGGTFALMGTTMAPGFDYADFEPAETVETLREWPAFRELITLLG